MIALGPKCYAGIQYDGKETCKVKGVSTKKNEMFVQYYLDVLDKQNVRPGIHTGLQMKNGRMVQITMKKNALTAAHTKMYCFPNHSCAPLIDGIEYIC